MNAARYGSSAAAGTGILVILGWVMALIAEQLARVGVTMPQEVQLAIVGLAVGPLLKWLQKEGIDVTDAPAPVPAPAPEVIKP